jgi:hypothetical protein
MRRSAGKIGLDHRGVTFDKTAAEICFPFATLTATRVGHLAQAD